MLTLVKVNRKPLPDNRQDLIFLSECLHIALERKLEKHWAYQMYFDRFGYKVETSEAQLALDDQFLTNRVPSYSTWGWFNMSSINYQ